MISPSHMSILLKQLESFYKDTLTRLLLMLVLEYFGFVVFFFFAISHLFVFGKWRGSSLEQNEFTIYSLSSVVKRFDSLFKQC